MKILGKNYEKSEIAIAIVLFGCALAPVLPPGIGGLFWVVAGLAAVIALMGAVLSSL